jgi:hypothetical protein
MKVILRIALVLLIIETIYFGFYWLNKKYNWVQFPLIFKSKVSLIKGFPDGVPQLPKTNLISSNKETAQKNDRYNGVWQSSDSVPEVVAWYLNDLPANDWKIDILPSNLKTTDIQYITAYKGNLYLQLSIVRKLSKTEITAQVTDKSKNNQTK